MTSDLESFLNYYAGQAEPGYAVLVTGAWGVGKTHQVKAALKRRGFHHVSLFGLRSAEEIHAAVFAAENPKGAKLKEAVGGFARLGGALSWLHPAAGMSGLAPSLVNAILQRGFTPTKLLVFDDLERCAMPLKETLGVLNHYVERLGCRVVALAPHEKLTEKDDADFAEIREKLFGRTFEVEPQIEEAFDAFAKRLKNAEARSFVTERKDMILETFRRSQAASLRVLRYAIDDLARLRGCLADRHLQHEESMAELIGLFVALDVEWHNGKIGEEDLERRGHVYFDLAIARTNEEKGQETTPPSPLAEAVKRHPVVDLASNLLSDELLAAMIFKGRYDKAALHAWLDSHPGFSPPEKMPPWKVVWNFDNQPELDADEAAERMEAQFKALEITDPGEIMHVCCLRMMMAQEGIMERSPEEIAEENLRYIADVAETRKAACRTAPPRRFARRPLQPRRLRICGKARQGDWFERLLEGLKDAARRVAERELPGQAKLLLELARIDAAEFRQQISSTETDRPNPFARVPVLHLLDPEAFVEAWLAGDPRKRPLVGAALEARYELRADVLEREREWGQGVLQALDARADAAAGFERPRIRRLASENLRRTLGPGRGAA